MPQSLLGATTTTCTVISPRCDARSVGRLLYEDLLFNFLYREDERSLRVRPPTNAPSSPVQELPDVVAEQAPVLSSDNVGIFGHSMGGHGALVCALKNPVRTRGCIIVCRFFCGLVE